jgi:hypothetical protein
LLKAFFNWWSNSKRVLLALTLVFGLTACSNSNSDNLDWNIDQLTYALDHPHEDNDPQGICSSGWQIQLMYNTQPDTFKMTSNSAFVNFSKDLNRMSEILSGMKLQNSDYSKIIEEIGLSIKALNPDAFKVSVNKLVYAGDWVQNASVGNINPICKSWFEFLDSALKPTSSPQPKPSPTPTSDASNPGETSGGSTKGKWVENCQPVQVPNPAYNPNDNNGVTNSRGELVPPFVYQQQCTQQYVS